MIQNVKAEGNRLWSLHLHTVVDMSGKGPPNKGRPLSCDASNTTAPFGIIDDSFLRSHVAPYAIECSSSQNKYGENFHQRYFVF
jgi:hypothetical protein